MAINSFWGMASERVLFKLIHKTCRTGLADWFDQGSGGSRRLAFAVPNYSLDACMNPFSQALPSQE
jgi:hypothetical protein